MKKMIAWLCAMTMLLPISITGFAQEMETIEGAETEISEATDEVPLIPTEFFDRYEYHASENIPAPADLVTGTDLSVNLKKRAQWTDPDTGEAKVTVQYSSNSGTLSVTPDMNVVLVHDKSGSMDANYGYHLEKMRKGWSSPTATAYYPILNGNQWSITVQELKEQFKSDAKNYFSYVTEPNAYTASLLGYDPGDGTSTRYYHYEVKNNSPCQLGDHFYLLIEEDPFSGIPAWTMVNGANLYNIIHTDLHHYVRISSREAALDYLSKGCRVLRLPVGSYYYDYRGVKRPVENADMYFLDNSELHQYDGRWILCTCTGECQTNDRLTKSQEFMDQIVDKILQLNGGNQIAYIPFWSDVPNNGSWTNWNGNEAGTGLENVTRSDQITSRAGVTKLGFTSDAQTLKAQIDHPFTYNGTNWGNAFQNALAMLTGRSASDKAKKTLVLFLTDGMPGGSEGKDVDRSNPALTGMQMTNDQLTGGVLYQLRAVPGITVWTVGVGINENDKTGLKDRLVAAADQTFYARTTGDFAELTQKVLHQIDETYLKKIYAEETFYVDQLGSDFELDTAKLDETWKVLSSPDRGIVKGVPENVYQAVQDSGITHVYVKSTKTVYWSIGKMSDGTYQAEGHTFSFPIQYLQYGKDTGGKDRMAAISREQYVSYYSTQEPSTQCKISIDVPQLVFWRRDSVINLNKYVTANEKKSRTYHYVCSGTRYRSGTVQNVDARAKIVIPAGASLGTAKITGLENGTYYIYEVDAKDRIVSSNVCETVVDYAPVITTKAYSSTIPWAVTKSDSEPVSNQDNYLKMQSEDSVLFDQRTNLTIVKEIDSEDEQICWEHGDPAFMIRIKGNGIDGQEYTFYHTFIFTKENVKKDQSNGKVSMSYTFTDLPVSEKYVIEEIRVGRYEADRISLYVSQDGNGSVVQGSESDPEVYGLHAQVNLKRQPQGIRVIFHNQKVNDKLFSDRVSVRNQIGE